MEHEIKKICKKVSRVMETFYVKGSCSNEWISNIWDVYPISITQGWLSYKFEEGDMVLINPHSLSLLKSKKGWGRKLLMKYDGPFKIIRKISPVSYWLKIPASYGIHPVLNITHLEKYQTLPPKFGTWPQKSLNWEDFDELPEYEVDKIVAEHRKRGQNGKDKFYNI